MISDKVKADTIETWKAEIIEKEHIKEVLDKIRAEIEKPLREEMFFDTDNAKAQAIALNWCIEIIDKYREDGE